MRPIVYFLVAIFGSSSWLSTNSIWLQLPLLTDRLPEGWSLPSYLALIVQIACIGPLIYTIVLKCLNNSIPVAPAIIFLLAGCVMAEFLLAFLWDITFRTDHSIMLMILMFFMALVNSTSNVLFLPYMGSFPPSYLTAYFVGMGLSSLIPSIFSLFQGTSEYKCVPDPTGKEHPIRSDPRFGITAYTLIMAVWMVFTLVAFCILHFFHDRLVRKEEIQEEIEEDQESSPLRTNQTEGTADPNTIDNSSLESFPRFCILLGSLAFICAQMNAVIPSIQSYATMPYSQTAYHLALTLSSLAHPLSSFLPLWIKPRRLGVLLPLIILATIFCGFIAALALQSPSPLWKGTVEGEIMIVIISVITAFLHSYLRTELTSVMQRDSPTNEGRLFWCGVFMQIGSFVGSLIMFPVVNFTNLFTTAHPCS